MNTLFTNIDGEYIHVAFEGDPDYVAKKYDLVYSTGNTLCPKLGIVVSTDNHWLTEHSTIVVMDENEWHDFEAIKLGVQKDTGENAMVDSDYADLGYANVHEYASSFMDMGSQNIIIYPTFEKIPHPGTYLENGLNQYNVWILIWE